MKNDTESWERLLYVLDWVLGVKLRHSESLDFSLAYINFDDRETLGNRYGAMQAARMLVELTHELDSHLRKTDIVARNGTDFWVFFPHIEAESVVPKVAKIIEVAAEHGFDSVERNISLFALTDNSILKQNGLDSPLLFLDYVKTHSNVARSWPVKKDEQDA